jgi:8-oxo-dGTP diphosphatase
MASPENNAIRIGLAVILHPERSEVLIARRQKGTHLAEYWEFPGGKVEAGETTAECAVREALEETGLNVTPEAEWDPVVFAYPDRTVLLCPVLCRTQSDAARPLGSDEIAWVGAAGLDTFTFPPANAPILAKLKSYLTGSAQ